jgi:hypothetical protein
VGLESTIVDLSRGEPVLLRPGGVPRADIARELGGMLRNRDAAAPRASGTLAAHYAPRTALALVPSSELEAELAEPANVAVLALREPQGDIRVTSWITAASDPARYGHDLYANLRTLDASGAKRIVVEAPPDNPAWEAVNDRLRVPRRARRRAGRRAVKAFLAIATLAATLAAVCAHAFPTDAEVREMLRQRIDVARRGAGIVVGLVDEKGSRVVAYGHARRGNEELVTGDSVFEVGSVTKVFTSLLLADMVEKGEVGLHDPIAKYVPPSVTSPRTQDITLLHLSRHTSDCRPGPTT